MDGTRIRRIELDRDENGQVDRWDFYDSKLRIEKVGFSQSADGVLDALAFYAGERLVRIEVSTRRDGRFDRVELYTSGVLDRSEEDTNGDGRVDKWATYRPNRRHAAHEPAYVLASVAFDDIGSGRPQRRIDYREGAHGVVATTHTASGSELTTGLK
jgi:hypothetical protein